MLPKHFSAREKIILSVCVAIILLYLGINFVFEPLKARLNDLNSQIALRELKLKKSNKVLDNQTGVEANYKKYADLIKQKANDEQEMSALLSEIESITKEIKISISDMKPSRVRVVDFYKKFSVELEAEGLLEDLTKFIHTLQSQPHFLKIERLRLERRSMRTNTLKGSILISRIRVP